jgi:ankyrin repeat protein
MQGHTPLDMCAANGHVEVMQFLLDQKSCEPDIRTKLGNNAVHLAALNTRVEACKLLINNGVDLKKKNKAGKTAVDLCPAEAADLKTYLIEKMNAEPEGRDDNDSEFRARQSSWLRRRGRR